MFHHLKTCLKPHLVQNFRALKSWPETHGEFSCPSDCFSSRRVFLYPSRGSHWWFVGSWRPTADPGVETHQSIKKRLETVLEQYCFIRSELSNVPKKSRIKGPENPTCQLLPISHKRKVKTEWERQERDMRWWKVRMKDLRVRELLGWMDGWMGGWMDVWMSVCLFVCLSVCLCVCTIWIDVKLLYFAGGNSPSSYVAQRSYGRCGGWVHGRMNLYLQYIYIIYIIRPWAHLSRSWGDVYLIAVVLYGQCLLWLYLSLYIYLLLLFILRVRFNWSVFCTSDAFHIRIRNDRSEQVCDSCWFRQGGMNPSGNACLSKELPLNWHFWISNSLK